MALVRFAPSPTGKLHVGNARTALINWLFARHVGGDFMLRIDDTDQERSKPEYEAGIRQDLAWLGLGWDLEAVQSERMDKYALAKQALIDAGRLYPCYDTPEELEIKRKMLVSRGKPPIYDRSALDMNEAQKAAYEAEGRKAHWRFKMQDAPIMWDDLIRGAVRFEGKNLSDPVLFRGDGVPLFTLTTSVDDGEHGITHILRGEDHVSNTAIQVQIMEALGHKAPVFGHTALLSMKGEKISKREGGGSVEALRKEGIMPMAINAYLAKIGTSDPVAAQEEMEALVREFDTAKFGRSMAAFDPEELVRLNQKLLHSLPFARVQNDLRALGLAQVDEGFWMQVQGNIDGLEDVKLWWELTQTPLQPVIEDAEFTAQAAEMLPQGEWNEESWGVFVAQVKAKSDRKGKQLFMPLRLALTGRSDGPELPKVFALLGRERAKKRLLGEVA